MRIVDRHITGAILLATLSGVLVISLAMMIGNVIQELLDLMVNQNLPMTAVLQFMGLVLPFTLSFTIPWAFLTALLLTFGRLSANNELMALQISGISLIRICLPALLLAAGLCAFCTWLNLDINPWAKQKLMDGMSQLATNDPLSFFSEHKMITSFGDRRISVGAKEGNTLKNLFIVEMNPEGDPTRMISAKQATVSRDPKTLDFQILMKDVRIEERPKGAPYDIAKIRNGLLIGEITYPLSLQKVHQWGDRKRTLSGKSFSELKAVIASGDADKTLPARVEYHRRFSLAFACLAFAMIGIPLGITAQRSETSFGFAISLVLAFSYMLFITIARVFANTPAAHPVLLMWLPNFLFFGLGLFLFKRLHRP